MLYKVLLEKDSTDWSKKKLMKCKDKEKFVLFQISQLYNSDFGRKNQISTNRPSPIAILSTHGSSIPASIHISIHPMQSPGIRQIFIIHRKPLDTIPISAAVYIQPSGTEFLPLAHTLPGTGFLPGAYM